MSGWSYRIAALVVLVVLALTWAGSFFGWGLPSTALARAERDAIRRRSLRSGLYGAGRRYGSGGGPRFGK